MVLDSELLTRNSLRLQRSAWNYQDSPGPGRPLRLQAPISVLPCTGLADDAMRGHAAHARCPRSATLGRLLHVPIFLADSRFLGDRLAVVERKRTVCCFHYDMPVLSHAAEDLDSFSMFTSSLCDKGQCMLVDFESVFAVTAISVKRALKQYRDHGTKSFFRKSSTGRGATDPVLREPEAGPVAAG
jgi:hypothetical protein